MMAARGVTSGGALPGAGGDDYPSRCPAASSAVGASHVIVYQIIWLDLPRILTSS